VNSTDVNTLSTLIGAALLVIGGIAGYYTAKRTGQQTAITLKNELIQTLLQKIEHLEGEIEDLRGENERLRTAIDALVEREEARERVQERKKRPTTTTP
jgi:TolA-binding protein